MIGACKRAWRCHYVALALSWTVSYATPDAPYRVGAVKATDLSRATAIPQRTQDASARSGVVTAM